MLRRKFDMWGGELMSNGDKCLGDPTAESCDGYAIGYLKNLLKFYIVGVAIIVVAVPEGLPLAVMISLSYSISKMLQDQNFVKRLSSCEIMGGANNICSDKTGTLTKNQMTWTQIWAGFDYKLKDVDGASPYDSSELSNFFKNEKTKELLSQAVACNCIGTVKDAGATELAMLKFINRCQVDYEALRKQLLPKEYLRFQFDSSRKRMSTVVELPEPHENGHIKRLHTKGASEIVVETCTHYLDAEGNKQELDDLMK
jgi:magnesium-transporting ATPase (P-type)